MDYPRPQPNPKPQIHHFLAAHLAALIFLNSKACVAPERAEETLEASGFTDIEVGGHAWFECAEGDSFTNTFTATSPKGTEVSGSVCCGVLKGCTVRF
jgi:hypothetical protein